VYSVEAEDLNVGFNYVLRFLIERGTEVKVKDYTTKELHPFVFEMRNPCARTLLYPYRGNNPFATLFETLWVLAGRSDIKHLEFFLPRAKDFSDDGLTWRAAYGGRMFTSGITQNPVDQFEYVYKTLKADAGSRQAVITIWDPGRDCTVGKTKDMPCSNRLCFMIRDGKLDLSLNIRSNDVLWGFSSINVYEFTVMQEIMATMLGVEVGRYYHIADSLHCYTGGGFNAEKNYKKLIKCMESTYTKRGADICAEAGHKKFSIGHIGFMRDYGRTMFKYKELYNQVVALFDMTVTPDYDRMVDIASHKLTLDPDIYLLLLCYIASARIEDQDHFTQLYKKVMEKVAMSDLKVACHYWMLKKRWGLKTTDIEHAYTECKCLTI